MGRRIIVVLTLTACAASAYSVDPLCVSFFGSEPRGHKSGRGVVMTADDKLYVAGVIQH